MSSAMRSRMRSSRFRRRWVTDRFGRGWCVVQGASNASAHRQFGLGTPNESHGRVLLPNGVTAVHGDEGSGDEVGG